MENKTHQSSELHFKEYQENLEGKATCNHMERHQLCQVLLLLSKSGPENVDWDALAKQNLSRAHTDERKGSETGLIAVIANSTAAFLEEGGTADKCTLDTLLWREPPKQIRTTTASQLIPVHSLLFSCLWSDSSRNPYFFSVILWRRHVVFLRHRSLSNLEPYSGLTGASFRCFHFAFILNVNMHRWASPFSLFKPFSNG
jgi:hypothetical protein